jgi:hypothetical protein
MNTDHPIYVSTEFGTYLNCTLKREMNKNNVVLLFKTNNKLSSALKAKKKCNEKAEGSGVYKLSCDDCPSFYIGQTARMFKT